MKSFFFAETLTLARWALASDSSARFNARGLQGFRRDSTHRTVAGRREKITRPETGILAHQ
jgi:hypothetical protein